MCVCERERGLRKTHAHTHTHTHTHTHERAHTHTKSSPVKYMNVKVLSTGVISFVALEQIVVFSNVNHNSVNTRKDVSRLSKSQKHCNPCHIYKAKDQDN